MASIPEQTLEWVGYVQLNAKRCIFSWTLIPCDENLYPWMRKGQG